MEKQVMPELEEFYELIKSIKPDISPECQMMILKYGLDDKTTFTYNLEVLFRDFDKLSQSSQQAIIDSYQHFVRKAAHFSIYAALSLFLCGYFVISDFFKKGYNGAFTFFLALLYCCTDEVHQYFIPGRSCQVTDIFIDTLGIICGILVFQLFYLLFKGKRGVASEK